jgi:hypothetical protein
MVFLSDRHNSKLVFESNVRDAHSPKLRRAQPANWGMAMNTLLLAAAEVVCALRKGHQVTLASLVGVLQRKGLLGMVDNEDTRFRQAQLVFVLIGRLTCFYSPSRYQVLQALCVSKVGLSDPPEILSQPMTRAQLEVPLASLIRRFDRYQSPIPGTNNISRPEYQTRSPRILEAANIFFHTLEHVADVRVLWTSSSGEHLHLDLRNKVLKLFRLPSFCAMITGIPTNQEKAVWDSEENSEQVPSPHGSYLSQYVISMPNCLLIMVVWIVSFTC